MAHSREMGHICNNDNLKPLETMKNLNITIEISSIAMDSIARPQQPKDILQKARQFLNQKMEQMGRFITCQLIDQRTLADDMQLEQYDLQYEKHTLRMQFMFFKPRGVWQVKGFSIN